MYRSEGGTGGAAKGWKAPCEVPIIVAVIADKLVGHDVGEVLDGEVGDSILLVIEGDNVGGARMDMAMHRGHHRRCPLPHY